MDWIGLEKIVKKFDLFGIQTHPIPLNPHGLRANRTSPKVEVPLCVLSLPTRVVSVPRIVVCRPLPHLEKYQKKMSIDWKHGL
jgi:hypothetical protein